jgi:small subunit ribosomal protein S27Ae
MSKKAPAQKKEEAPPAEAPKPDAKPQAKAEKPKREKSKRKEVGVHAMYKVEGEKVSRTRPTCERCGPGYFMGDHKDRFTCGHCGFTRYKTR